MNQAAAGPIARRPDPPSFAGTKTPRPAGRIRAGRGLFAEGLLYVFGAHLPAAALADHQADGGVLQTEALADLIDDIPLIAEMEQRLGVHKGHKRRRTGGGLGQIEDLEAAALVGGGLDPGRTPVGTRAPFWLSTSRISRISRSML